MNGGFATRAAALLAALAVGTSAQAQAVKDFQLPPGTPAPVAGPTDSEVPAPTPVPQPSPPPVAVPRPTPTPVPTRTAPPAPRAAAPAVRPSPRPAATATPAPRPAARPAAAPTPAPAPPPAPVPSETAPAVEATAAASPTPSESAAPAPVAAAQGFPDWLLWLAAAAGALLLAFGGYLFGRRSRQGTAEPDHAADEQPAYAPTPPESTPLAEAAALPDVSPSPPARPLPKPAFAPSFDMTLEPLRMTMALINASLTYRLAIVNRDDKPLGPLRITCDLISAHASLQQAEQLVPDPASGWLSYDFAALPPGENLVIDGEVKLPRTEILPIRSGNSPLFVPLARFTLQTVENGVAETIGARVFVIGEEPEQPGAGLKPFRLNDGTRSYSRIGQREVSIAS